MKSKYFLILMLLGHLTILSDQEESNEKTTDENLCYCSDLCGPRKVTESDAPFYDEEYGLCFCKQRDKDNYVPHGCNLKEKPNFESYCDKHNKK